MSVVVTLPPPSIGESSNPFEVALADIAASRIRAPEQYKYRLGVQLALCVLLIVVSLAFLVASGIDSRRRDKGIWLVRIQRPKNLIVVNSLNCFTTTSLLAAVGLLYSRWHNWTTYIRYGDGRNSTLISVIPWLIIQLQAWVFSFTNLLATVTARRSLGVTGAQQLLVNNPWIQSTAFLGVPIVVITCSLTLSTISSVASDMLLALLNSLVPLLQAASASLSTGQGLDPDLLADLEQKQFELSQLRQKSLTYSYAWSAFGELACLVIFAMNAYSLILVLLLRGQSKSNQERRLAHGHAPSATQASYLSAVPSMSRIPQTNTRMTALVGQSQNEKAMDKLAADLSIAVPMVILQTCIVAACLGLLCAKISTRLTWTDVELSTDMFQWSYLLLTNATVIFLIYNLWRHWTTKADKFAVALNDLEGGEVEKAQSVESLADAGDVEKVPGRSQLGDLGVAIPV